LGAAAMRMGGPKPDKMYRVFKKVSSNSFFWVKTAGAWS
jgi:hypothetical protein